MLNDHDLARRLISPQGRPDGVASKATRGRTAGGFTTMPPVDGVMFDDAMGILPSRMTGFVDATSETFGDPSSTTYGYVYDGEVTIERDGAPALTASVGQYFSGSGALTLRGEGRAVLFERIGYCGPFALGGPIEGRGRVTYIDGCSTSILVFPQRQGDPVLNILWFPPNVTQTMHIHPTVRLAMVVHGRGDCVLPGETIDLVEGNVFHLEPMAPHCFHTRDSGMAIITYHPDSDWGPTDTIHPMMRQTIAVGN